MPGPGGYWLPRPESTASAAARAISGGPSLSGKPWPRLIDPVVTASADISAKIVVPSPASLRFSSGRLIVYSVEQPWSLEPGPSSRLVSACECKYRRREIGDGAKVTQP